MPSASSSPAIANWIVAGDIEKLRRIREEMGDDRKFRRRCDTGGNSAGFKVLHLAAGFSDFEMCHFLIEEVGVDVNVKTNKGFPPLIFAVKNGRFDMAEYLIEHGADVTMADSRGCTPLHYSVPHGNTKLMTLLLTKGADVDADSVVGTPLNAAARNGSAGTVKFLLQNKAKPDTVSKYLRIPPLVSAIYSKTNTVECVELLLKAKADPNKVSNGLCPLTHAIEVRSNNCINSLLAAGADVDSVSSNGLRPIDHAALECNIEAIWILIRARPRILATPNWSLVDLITSINPDKAKERKSLYSRNMKQKGDDAWDKKDYSSAIASYSEAIRYNKDDEKVLGNRSICWARMGEGVFALHDAQSCIDVKQDSAKAHLREAIAWHLLKRYHMSSKAFKRAYELAPEKGAIDV